LQEERVEAEELLQQEQQVLQQEEDQVEQEQIYLHYLQHQYLIQEFMQVEVEELEVQLKVQVEQEEVDNGNSSIRTGTTNTGGGGGGAGPAGTTGAAGGSGIVIVKELNKASGSWPLRAQFSAARNRERGRVFKALVSVLDYLVVAGGGGGGQGMGSGMLGGGGAGGYSTSFPGGTKITLTDYGPYSIQ
jgi:uncharacterized membrane protein